LNHFEGRERLQNLKMVNWFNLDGPTILIKFKTRGKEIQFSCSAVVYFETRKLNPAADQSLFLASAGLCVWIGRTPCESNSSSNFRRFDNELQE